jgi:hypothetical protein
MVMKRFAAVMAVAFALQAVVFSSHYQDLLALRAPATELAASPRTFQRLAEQALARPRLTRAHLERIAEAATLCGAIDIEVSARERLWSIAPDEPHLGAQLGDALRRARRFDESERVFRQLLATSPSAEHTK